MRAHPKVWAMVADIVCVFVFVSIGRSSHAEGLTLSGIVSTALPFLIALAVTRAVPMVAAAPGSLRAGVAVWSITTLGGMGVRRFVFGDGTAPSFIVVATLFLGFAFLGWRIVARQVRA